MSLYNMLFGTNPLTPFILAALNLDMSEIPRFRDVELEGSDKLLILTRTGGGNRDYYDSPQSRIDSEAGLTDEDLVGPYNQDLRGHSCFLYEHDMEDDATYAEFTFKVPEEFVDFFKAFDDWRNDDSDETDFQVTEEYQKRFKARAEEITARVKGDDTDEEAVA